MVPRSPVQFLKLFSNFWRFWYHKKVHFFLITHGKFHSWKVFRLEDTNENMSSYGNHNQASTVRYRQLQYKIASYVQTAWPFQVKF